MNRRAIAVLGWVSLACSGSNDAPKQGDGSAFPATHPAMPQVANSGGPVMVSPKIVAVTFQADPLATYIGGFVQDLVTNTDYWSGATREYGVGSLSATTPIQLSETAPATMTDADIQAFLTQKMQSDSRFPKADGNTIYVLFFTQDTDVIESGAHSCVDFGGYHSDYALTDGGFVSYAVIGRCSGDVPGFTTLDEVTAIASHEITEAATDPRPVDMPAYGSLDSVDFGWESVVGGGEIGDMCRQAPDAFLRTSSALQRVWSNAAAAAGHDPCQPSGMVPYFNSAPVLADTISIQPPSGPTLSVQGVSIPVGQSKTIELDLYSDAPTSAPWTVRAIDVETAYHRRPALSFVITSPRGKNGFGSPIGQNGDKLSLTLTALRAVPGGAGFILVNELATQATEWVGVVGN